MRRHALARTVSSATVRRVDASTRGRIGIYSLTIQEIFVFMGQVMARHGQQIIYWHTLRLHFSDSAVQWLVVGWLSKINNHELLYYCLFGGRIATLAHIYIFNIFHRKLFELGKKIKISLMRIPDFSLEIWD